MDKLQLADLWKFPWPLMEVLIGGRSSIDLNELRVGSWEEATAFLHAYGYDPDNPADGRRIHAGLIEAVTFIERQLLAPREWRRIKPPDDILYADDVRHLLLAASSKGPTERLKRAWACAILRVLHTIAHIEGVTRSVDIAVAREQIFARFQEHLTRDAAGRLWLGADDVRVELAHVEWKAAKTRNSILLKLLHKRDNVAETIYDFIGIRFVTKSVSDVMLVVKCLRHYHMIVYPNAYPSRARNNLLDLKRFRVQIETLREMLTAGSISPDEFESMVGRLSASAPAAGISPVNPHSAASYRSIQLTGRQIIRTQDSQLEWLAKLKHAQATETLPPGAAQMLAELVHLVEGWHSVKDERDIAAFFPFEVQILDAESYALARTGDANHDRYKLSQVRAARKRVLGKVLELSRQAQSSDSA